MYWFSVTAVTNSYKDGGFKTIEIDSLTAVGVREAKIQVVQGLTPCGAGGENPFLLLLEISGV